MRHGIAPYNVSHWDPDPGFVGGLPIQPKLRVPSSPFEYVFSYRISSELKTSLACKLGYTKPRAVLLAPSGTAANLVALNLLRHLGMRRLWIVLPAYFQIPIAAQQIGFEVICVDAKLTAYGWEMPDISALNTTTDALWVTNPIYGIGDSFGLSMVNALLAYVAAGGSVVGDECLCPISAEISRRLGIEPGFIGTYSPHKSVCMNGVKLGAVIADPAHLETLEHLSDVWAGPLTQMSISDAEHFLSENFDQLDLAIRTKLNEAARSLEAICDHYGCTLIGSTGTYRTVRVNGVQRELEQSLKYLSKLVLTTGTSFIPAFLNLGVSGVPFSFRINLARRTIAMEAALSRLLGAIRLDGAG